MAIAGPGGVDAAIASGIDLDGTPIPAEMIALYTEVMDLESQRARSGVKKSMRNRIVKTGSKHFDQASLDRLDRNPDPLRAAVGSLDADTLQVGTELTLGDARHVRTDAAALLGLTLTIDDRALDGAATGDCTNSGHGVFRLVKGPT